MLSCSANDILESLQVTGAQAEFVLWKNNQLVRCTDTIKAIIYSNDENTVQLAKLGSIPAESFIFANQQFVHNPFIQACDSLTKFLKAHSTHVQQVIQGDFAWIPVDLSKYNAVALNGQYVNYLLGTCNNFDKTVGFGGYGEDRPVYAQHALFQGTEDRSIHLGIDIWAPAGTPVCSPWDGVIHSFADNAGAGNYGPTIILAHQQEGVTFYSLYGHLSRESLAGIQVGQRIQPGTPFCEFGNEEENGNWFPHVHYQVMANMLGMNGDFPGVCAKSESDFWLQVCKA